MALTTLRRAELASMKLPSEADMRWRMRVFQQRAGLTLGEFADEIGYAATSVGLFLSGKYNQNHPKAENTLALRAAAKEFMDRNEVDLSPRLGHTHYETSSFLRVREAAYDALAKSTAYILDGPSGTEKSESLRRIEAEINGGGRGRAVYVYARAGQRPQSFLLACCVAAGVPMTRGAIDQILLKVQHYLGKGRTLLIVDEAQHLDHGSLEVLRQLVDLPPYFGVLVAGSHDLTQRLSHWQMEQWRGRVRETIVLNGPSRKECHDILRAEFGEMTDESCDEQIARCQVTAERTRWKDGKPVAEAFAYTSARALFYSIEMAQEQLTAEKAEKEGAV